MLATATIILGITIILILIMEYNFRQVKKRTEKYLAEQREINEKIKSLSK